MSSRSPLVENYLKMKARKGGFFFPGWERRRRALLAEYLTGLPAGARILDAGCGDGSLSRVIANLGFDVVGVDISEKAIAEAKDNHSNAGIEFMVASLEQRLPFQDGEFQGVWCSEVLEHVAPHKNLWVVSGIGSPPIT